jgi:hypothetical protein
MSSPSTCPTAVAVVSADRFAKITTYGTTSKTWTLSLPEQAPTMSSGQRQEVRRFFA